MSQIIGKTRGFQPETSALRVADAVLLFQKTLELQRELDRIDRLVVAAIGRLTVSELASYHRFTGRLLDQELAKKPYGS